MATQRFPQQLSLLTVARLVERRYVRNEGMDLKTIGARSWVCLFAAFYSFIPCGRSFAQKASDPLSQVSHSASLNFIRNDGSCLRGSIVSSNAATIRVQPFKKSIVSLDRREIAQVSQGNALLYSSRSSWKDVTKLHLYPRETLLITLRNGKRTEGWPLSTTARSITMKHGFSRVQIAKSDVSTVYYLRMKPATDEFELALEEAPYALGFYPEFYLRALGLEGRVHVRLYDAAKPEDDRTFGIKICSD